MCLDNPSDVSLGPSSIMRLNKSWVSPHFIMKYGTLTELIYQLFNLVIDLVHDHL